MATHPSFPNTGKQNNLNNAEDFLKPLNTHQVERNIITVRQTQLIINKRHY